MENSEAVVKQLKSIKWLIVTITASFVLAVAIVSAVVVYAVMETSESLAEGACGEQSFSDQAKGLIEKGELEGAIRLANERISTHPNDADAYWQRAMAYYLSQEWEKAITDLDKVEQLAPSWKSQFVDPYRMAAKAKLADG